MKEFCSGVKVSGASSEGILQWSERMCRVDGFILLGHRTYH